MYTLEAVMEEVERKNPPSPEFHQAVKEVVRSVIDVVNENPVYEKHKILERMIEPDRIISFRVEWEDDGVISRSTAATGPVQQHPRPL